MTANELHVKLSSVMTSATKETLISIGFTGVLATDKTILSFEGLLPLIEVGVF